MMVSFQAFTPSPLSTGERELESKNPHPGGPNRATPRVGDGIELQQRQRPRSTASSAAHLQHEKANVMSGMTSRYPLDHKSPSRRRSRTSDRPASHRSGTHRNAEVNLAP